MSEQGFGDFEFERKFFLHAVPEEAALDPAPTLIVQAYLFAADGYAVRVRVQGPAPSDLSADPGVLVDALGENATGTMAAKGPAVGGTRYEAERELDALVAGQIVRRAEHVVAKVRYSVWLGEDGWVVDDFLGTNAPLVMAEVERGGPVVDLAIPDFCVTEVSEDDRFRNEYLAHLPFGGWAQAYARELALLGPRFVRSLGSNRLGGL
ncbi:CYTH domain-containing protein [Tsukamurella serpentis]